MRKRRAKPGIWLPPDPFNRVEGSIAVPSQSAIGHVSPTPVAGIGASTAASVPIVGDYNEEVIAGMLGFSLADEVGGGYRLRRVVGKIFVAVRQAVDDENPGNATSCIAWAGLIVRRVDTVGNALSTAVFADAYENQRDPYIWRRDWALTNYLSRGAAVTKTWQFPTQNCDYGDSFSGPHVDAQTKRSVGAEERLYLDVGYTNLDGDPQAIVGIGLDVWWDLRMFGYLMPQGQGNRRNASR